jgi:hypothetical protein
MANWFIAPLQFGIGIVHRLLILRNALLGPFSKSIHGNPKMYRCGAASLVGANGEPQIHAVD